MLEKADWVRGRDACRHEGDDEPDRDDPRDPSDPCGSPLEWDGDEAEDEKGDHARDDADAENEREGDMPLALGRRPGMVDEEVTAHDAGDAAGGARGREQDRLYRPRPRDEGEERERAERRSHDPAARGSQVEDGAQNGERREREGAQDQRSRGDGEPQQERARRGRRRLRARSSSRAGSSDG